jgi:two-component system cell cycle response regulator DivK
MEGGTEKRKKILIVEDDFSSKLYLNKLLERTGALLLNASDGNEALNLLQNNLDIDLILMDIQMPVMDGYSCTKIIRDSGNKVIIIAQTAYGLDDDREKMVSAGFNDILIKPISQKLLIDKINFYLLMNQASG